MQGFERALAGLAPGAGFGGGLSTGLAGLQGLSSSMMGGAGGAYSSASFMSGGVPTVSTSVAGGASSSSSSSNGADYLAGRAPPDMANFAMAQFAGYPAVSRPDDLFYGGLRSSMQQSAAAAAASHFRPEDNPLNPARSMPSLSAASTSYHDR